MLEAKRALLSGALKAFVGVHPKQRLKHLGISEEKLQEVGINGDSPSHFWQREVPMNCLLREAGIRAMSAQPSSTAVERLWNVFGDNLTAKRRCLKNSSLGQLMYARMTMVVLDKNTPDVVSEFENVLEFIDSVSEQELVDGIDGEEVVAEGNQLHDTDSDDSSGSGNAEEWILE